MAFLHSLRFRLALLLVFVALTPVLTAALLIQRATADAFDDYNSERARADAESIVTQIDELTGQQFIVIAANQGVVAGAFGSGGGAPGSVAGEPSAGGSFALSNEPVTDVQTVAHGGSITATEAGSATGGAGAVGGVAGGNAELTLSLPGLPDEQFLSAMNRALLIAVGLATCGALVLAALLARRILQPVESLTVAARGMAAGDLQQRVTVNSRDEIGLLGDAFNAMAESRARLDTLRRNLVNDVAHELRTPLANLQGYLELLRDGLVTPAPAVMETLHDESLLLSRLVADLQELALAEAGELPLDPGPVDLTETIEQAIDAHTPQAEAKQIALVADLPEDRPFANTDAARLSQILRNLLRNAITHTPPGGAIVVGARCDGSDVSVFVRDSGAGIAPEHLPHVFERFYRGDPARSRGTGGSGLGLAIVKHLVEAQDGRIEVVSAPGAGTTFRFWLPGAVSSSLPGLERPRFALAAG